MSGTVSDHLIERINEWGVKRIYGYPGDGINGIIGALERAGDRIEYVQVRHEEMAAFMACAHAKFTGEVGVCLATSGPGAIHLLNGLYDAKMDHQPVVAIVGQQARAALGGSLSAGGRPDLALQGRGAATTSTWHRCRRRCAIWSIARIRIAKAERTVTCIIVPNDVQELDAVEKPPRAHGTVHSGLGYCYAARRAEGARSAAGGRHSERRAKGRDAGRRRRAGGDRRSDAGRRAARRRRRQGAARQGRAARRSAVLHRLDRAARHASRAGT